MIKKTLLFDKIMGPTKSRGFHFHVNLVGHGWILTNRKVLKTFYWSRDSFLYLFSMLLDILFVIWICFYIFAGWRGSAEWETSRVQAGVKMIVLMKKWIQFYVGFHWCWIYFSALYISYSLSFTLSSFSHFGHCFREMWFYSLGVYWFIATIILDTLFCWQYSGPLYYEFYGKFW
jgi:hypothetical protein